MVLAGVPAYIPWQQDRGTDNEPKFVCDVMTEGLAKQLRLCGVDAAAVPTLGKTERHVIYRCVPAWHTSHA